MNAQAKIKDQITPFNWTQRTFARDKDGKSVALFSEDAVCWCLGGWYKKVYGKPGDCFHEIPQYVKAVNKAYEDFGQGLTEFNDKHSFTVVKAFLDLLGD